MQLNNGGSFTRLPIKEEREFTLWNQQLKRSDMPKRL